MPEEKAAKSGYILLIEDDRGTCELEAQRLEPLGLELRKAYNAAEAKAALAQGAPAMMLLDYSLPDADALEFVAELKASAGEVPPFLLVTGRGDEAVAVAAMKAGACDYLVKDGFFLERLPAVMLKALNDAEMRARLKESEERLRVFFEYSNVGKSITSPEGKVQPNPELCRMLGYSRDELAALNWREITPAEDIPPTEKIVAELAQGVRNNARFEKRYLRKDGGVIWADVNVSVKRDSGGRLLYFLTTILDITERRKLEAELGREEARYKELFENISGAVAVYRPVDGGGDFIFLAVNAALEKIERVRRADLLGRRVTEVFPGVRDFGILEAFRRVSATGEPERFPVSKYKDSRISGWRDNYIYRLPEGEVVTVYTDLTAEMQAREKLEFEEARYRALLESLPDVVMSFDREHRHRYVSPNISGLGIVASGLIGKSHRAAGFPDEQCRIFEENIDRVFKTGRQHEIEFEADLPAGRRAFNWRLVPQADAAGGVESVTTFARDITQVRQLRADYKHLFDSMQDGFAVHEMIFGPGGEPVDYRFLSLNPAFCALTGLGKEAAEGQLVSKIMPDSYREWVGIYGRVVLTGESDRFEKFSEDLGKHFSILAFRNKPGQFSTLFTDISERKKSEETLLRQNVLLELAGRAASFGGWVVDLSTNICTWSDQVAAIHEEPAGFSPAVDKGISYYAPEWREKITQVFAACARDGVAYDEEMEILTAKGNRRWVRAIGQAGLGQDGKINRVYGSLQDISARKKVEAALRASEATFRQLVEHSPDGIFLQLDGSFEYINPEALRLLGAGSEQELLGKPIYEIFRRDFHEVISDRIKQLTLENVRVPEIEEFCVRRDGSEFPALVSAVPFEKEGRRGAIVTIRDVTAKKIMEEELLRSQKIESLGVLAGGIAHDFNNMLMGVTANLSLLASKNPPNAEIIEEAISAARSAQALASQLLSFSRGGQPLRKELCLERPLREIYALTVSGSAVKQALAVGEGLWSAEVDENQVKQAVGNILINGLQAMPAGGELGLKAENLEVGPDTPLGLAPGKYLKITATDTGIGIPAKYLPQVFDPYFTTKPGGNGLGLAMAWTVVKNHGGHIAVSSEQGKGSVFEVYLPASGRSLGEKAGKPGEIPKASGRILLLDDDEIVLKAVKRMLEELGYSYEATGDGRETLRRYEEAQKEGRPFDAVIMDLTIPGGMGGAEAGPELRRRFPEAVIIVSSGYSDEAVMSDHKAFGFDAVLPKPYQYEALAAVLAEQLKKE
jgi:PAS domain S-box-containing protein